VRNDVGAGGTFWGRPLVSAPISMFAQVLVSRSFYQGVVESLESQTAHGASGRRVRALAMPW
jgi:hypothetical protein